MFFGVLRLHAESHEERSQHDEDIRLQKCDKQFEDHHSHTEEHGQRSDDGGSEQ